MKRPMRLIAATVFTIGSLAVAPAWSSAAGAADQAVAAADDQLILAGDAASRQLIAFDPAVTDWNGAGAVRWTWRPTTGLGYSTDASAYGEYKLAAAHATLWGHDVSPYTYDTGKLWVTTNGGAYLYDKATKSFTPTANRGFVKAMSNQPSGQIVQTMADAQKTPKGPCAAVNGWCTDTVDFFAPDGRRTRAGAQFYKARVLNPYYGVVDRSRRGKVWDRTRAADRTWPAAVRVNPEPDVLEVYATGRPDGVIHVGKVPELS